MTSGFSLASTLMLLGALQAAFLALALIDRRRGPFKANRLLAILMALTALRLVSAALVQSRAWRDAAAGLYWTAPLILTFPPLLYLYVRALILPGFRFRPAHWLHFLPAGIFSILELLPVAAAALSLPLSAPWSGSRWTSISAEALLDSAWFVQTLVYIILIVRMRRTHVRRARETLASPEKVRLDWIRNLAAGFGALDFLVLLFLLHLFAGLPLPKRPEVVLNLAIAAFILSMGYFGLRRPEVFSREKEGLPGPGTAAGTPRGPADAPAEEVRRLIDYTERERPYLNPDLTLFDLARALSLPPYQLSALLNRGLGRTFFEFVNGYRVEEAKRRLLDPDAGRVKILALALECGFNSKSAFNRVFKDITGLTPSEFQRSYRSG